MKGFLLIIFGSFALVFYPCVHALTPEEEDVIEEEQADEAEEIAEEQEIAGTNDEADALEGDGTVFSEIGAIGFEEYPSVIDGEGTDNNRFGDNEEAFSDFDNEGGAVGLADEEPVEEEEEEEEEEV